MRKSIMLAAVLLAACSQNKDVEVADNNGSLEASAPDDSGKLWTTVQYADRHSCPSTKCGIVGRLGFREAATPLETKDGWTRTTKFYDGACENGRSQYVDKGPKECTKANGFDQDGKFAEWVRSDQLSTARPPDPADKATDAEQLVKDSDDFNLYHTAFAKVANQLIAEGRCTAGDFEEQGGWVKSVNNPDEPVYFTYCGGMTAANKIYMNAKTASVL